MRITSITIAAGRKINLGNYEQAHLELSITAELDDGDDPASVRSQLWAEAKSSLKEQTAPFLKQRQEQVDSVYNGLPADVQEQIR